jgi:hypothetical protein
VSEGQPPDWTNPRAGLAEKVVTWKVPVCESGPDTINQELKEFYQNARDLVREWLQDSARWRFSYGKQCLVSAITRARKSANDFPLLDQAIWQQGYHFTRCQYWWKNTVSAQFADFRYLFGQGSSLLMRLSDLGKLGLTGGVGKRTIARVQMRVAQLKAYWRQVSSLMSLVKKWGNKHQECWVWTRESWTLSEKIRIVEELIEWQTETADLMEELNTESEEAWKDLGLDLRIFCCHLSE